MVKKRFRRTRKLFKNVFPVRFWGDEKRIKAFFFYIFNIVQQLFFPQKKEPEESFAEAQRRLKITDEQLEKRQHSLFLLSILMFSLAMLIVLYAIYQVVNGSYLGAVVAVSVSIIAFALAFRYHFWYFQFKQRKLGCSLKDWLQEGLFGGKK